jgi:hypothetical protein
MPSTGFASYINNRLIFARNRDTVAVSDVLDADLYDPFWNSFRVAPAAMTASWRSTRGLRVRS